MLPRLALTLLLGAVVGTASAHGDAKRGEYIATAGGCIGCHTEDRKDAAAFAGGRPLKTPFGTFYGPNITPDNEHGIGRWSEADFIRALRFGERRDGSNYYPAFPYPSFTHISDDDLGDLWAYLRTLPPNPRASQPHALRFPFGWRFLVTAWKSLYFTPGPFVPNPALSESRNRGAYLVQALGHCGECHTPRDFLGGPKTGRFLAGGKGPDGKRVPNLTPTRLKSWTDAELRQFFVTGDTPDGDSAAEPMDEVIRTNTSRLSAQDHGAMIVYLRTLPALPDEPR
jgi:mono/diheme cytochrome c family protein